MSVPESDHVPKDALPADIAERLVSLNYFSLIAMPSLMVSSGTVCAMDSLGLLRSSPPVIG